VKILLSGFEPFNKARTNSSELVVREIEKQDFDFEVTCVILPVVYQAAFTQLKAIFDEVKPDAVISLGQAEGRTAISLERNARNKDDVPMADNNGEIRSEMVIIDAAPELLPTSLPIEDIYQELMKSQVPVEYSESAGNFLCNNLFYNSQFAFTNTPSGFIHLPLAEIQAPEFPQKPHLPLEVLVRGVEITLKTTASVLAEPT
jgi:pyroglutamyl-peptidase